MHSSQGVRARDGRLDRQLDMILLRGYRNDIWEEG